MTPDAISIAESGRSRAIGPVRIAIRNTDEAISEVLEAISVGRPRIFAFCNMHTFNVARVDKGLARSLSIATIYNDGVGMDVASRVLYGERFPANLNGTDLVPLVLSSAPFPVNVYILGSPPGVAEAAAAALTRRFPAIRVVGTHHGFFSDEDEARINDEICRSGAKLVLVGMGNPRQEIWAARNFVHIKAVVLCVGALLDFSAQRISRAPRVMRRLRMEWLYRLTLEPRRLLRRYVVGGVEFVGAIVVERVRSTRRK